MTEQEHGRRRKKRKEIYFTEEEFDYVMKKVEQSSMNTFQSFALQMLITGEVKLIDYAELYRLNWEVNRIGNNINQITLFANRFDEISNSDIQDIKNQLDEIQSLIKTTLKQEIKSNKLPSKKEEVDLTKLKKLFVD